MSWMSEIANMREQGWVVTALPPDVLKGLTGEEKSRVESTMVLAAYNMIEKIHELHTPT